MKHLAIAKVRGLLLVLERSNDPDELLWVLGQIVEQLKAFNKTILSLKQQNTAGSRSPR
jgi:hypothetical protein